MRSELKRMGELKRTGRLVWEVWKFSLFAVGFYSWINLLILHEAREDRRDTLEKDPNPGTFAVSSSQVGQHRGLSGTVAALCPLLLRPVCAHVFVDSFTLLRILLN